MADVTNTGGEQKKVVPDWLSKVTKLCLYCILTLSVCGGGGG